MLNELNARITEKVISKHATTGKLRKTCRLWEMGASVFLLLALATAPFWSDRPLQAQQSLRTEREFHRFASELPLNVQWLGGELRDQIGELAALQKLGVWIDRNVDSSQIIQLAVSNATCEQILWLVAEQTGAGVAKFGNVLYLGPRRRAVLLPQWMDELERQVKTQVKGGSVRQRLTAKIDPSVPAWVRPREWLAALGNQQKLSIEGLERIPHDVWSAQSLPPMPVIEAIALWSCGFDLWPTVKSDGTIALEPIVYPTTWTRSYPDLQLKMPAVEELLAKHPAAKASAEGGGITITADTDFFSELDYRLAFRHAPAGATPSGKQLYTISTRATRGSLLASLAQQLSLEFEFAPEARSVLEDNIKLEVNGVALDKLLEQITEGTRLDIEITQKKLKASLR